MKTLIIHPTDPTTNFLKGIYNNLQDKKIITGNVTKLKLQKDIETHDRIICSMVESLKNKPNTFFIWCYASEFVQRNGLTGLNCQMFISSVDEAWMYKFWDVEWDTIRESNESFAKIVAKYAKEPMDVLYRHVMRDYGKLAMTNPIAKFNHERMYLTLPQKPVMFADRVLNMN